MRRPIEDVRLVVVLGGIEIADRTTWSHWDQHRRHQRSAVVGPLHREHRASPSLLSRLVDHGLDADHAILFLIDSREALR
jgi:hypothetical protein